MTPSARLAAFLWLVASCGGSTPSAHEPGVTYDTSLPETQEAATEGDAPEISRSQGTPGGVVVLWPRIVRSRRDAAEGADDREVARRLQAKLAALVRDNMPGVPVDIRPEPERVCPRSGCLATSVGVLLTRSGKGCTATALVARQGSSPSRLIPWAGAVKLKESLAAFREPPEQQVQVVDHARCESIVQDASSRDQEVVEAIRRSMP